MTTGLVGCTQCGVPQLVVTGTGLLRTHDRIGVATGVNYGLCPGSGQTPATPTRGEARDESAPAATRCRGCQMLIQVTPAGVYPRHRKPDGTACLASRRSPDWLKSQDQGATVAWRCRVCNQPTRHHVSTNVVNDHLLRKTDLLCPTSGRKKSWLPADRASGYPTRRADSEAPVSEVEARRHPPKVTRATTKAKVAATRKSAAAAKRKGVAQTKASKSAAANGIRVLAVAPPAWGNVGSDRYRPPITSR